MWAGIAPWWWLHQGFLHWTLCKQRSPVYCNHNDDDTDDGTGIDDENDFDDVDDNDDDDDTDDIYDDTRIDDFDDDTDDEDDDDTDDTDDDIVDDTGIDFDDADLLFREVALDTEHLHNVPAIDDRSPIAFILICWHFKIRLRW